MCRLRLRFGGTVASALCLLVFAATATAGSAEERKDPPASGEPARSDPVEGNAGAGTEEKAPSPLTRARKQASGENRYLVVYFTGTRPGVRRRLAIGDDTPSVIEEAVKKWSKKLSTHTVDLGDQTNQEDAEAYGVDAGPFVLIVAPNGAITGHFRGLRSLAEIERSFVSPTMAEILKAMQGSKVIFLRVLNDESEGRNETIKATDAVAKLLKGSAAVVTLDPDSDQDERLVGMLGLKPPVTEAVTFVVSPGGQIVERIDGAPSRRQVLAGFQKALAGAGGCGSGCGGGGGGEPCD
jgi:hypothetical protein